MDLRGTTTPQTGRAGRVHRRSEGPWIHPPPLNCSNQLGSLQKFPICVGRMLKCECSSVQLGTCSVFLTLWCEEDFLPFLSCFLVSFRIPVCSNQLQAACSFLILHFLLQRKQTWLLHDPKQRVRFTDASWVPSISSNHTHGCLGSNVELFLLVCLNKKA